MNINQALQSAYEKMIGWAQAAIAGLPNLALAILVLIAFWLGARAARGILRRLLSRVTDNRTIVSLIATIGYSAILLIGFFVALGILGLDKTVTSLLAGVGVIGLALGFAFQDLAANFMAGILMAVRRPFSVGDIIESSGFMGVIEEVNLRATHLRTFQGQIVMIPNKDVFGNPIINFTGKSKRRVDLGLGVAYGDDLEKAKQIAIQTIEGLELRDESREVELFYTEFGDSSINFVVRFWIDFGQQTDFLEAQSEAIMRIKRAFDEGGITIPFPIRTLDFGVVGGEPLAEAVPERWFSRSQESAGSSG